jgi:hypothetical protein
MKAMQSTMVYLTQEQRTGLAKRAQQRKTKVAAEIRSAVDAYLAGVTPQELDVLDATTRRAKEEIDAMVTTAEGIVASHAGFLREMRKLRKESPR